MAFKAITRIGDLEASHDGCPESRLVEGDHRITIFGQPVGRIGDDYEAHSSSQEDEHRDYIKEGINAVKAWGIPIAIQASRVYISLLRIVLRIPSRSLRSVTNDRGVGSVVLL